MIYIHRLQDFYYCLDTYNGFLIFNDIFLSAGRDNDAIHHSMEIINPFEATSEVRMCEEARNNLSSFVRLSVRMHS